VLSDSIISSEYKFIITIIEMFYSFYIDSWKLILGMLYFYRISL